MVAKLIELTQEFREAMHFTVIFCFLIGLLKKDESEEGIIRLGDNFPFINGNLF